MCSGGSARESSSRSITEGDRYRDVGEADAVAKLALQMSGEAFACLRLGQRSDSVDWDRQVWDGKRSRVNAGYDRVILSLVKTAISLPDATFERVERAAQRLGVSRSEFFARAAERWLQDLGDEQTTDAINQALDDTAQDTAFLAAAAQQLAARSDT